jgi:hypothetical protein
MWCWATDRCGDKRGLNIQPTCLVIADISGYTKFIRNPRTSLLHAEQIITDLLDAVIDESKHPLQLNKLEGDAALLYAVCGDGSVRATVDVLNQVKLFFDAFRMRQNGIIADGDGGCGCDACTNVASLRLKVVMHVGDVLFKRIRHFEEMAGEPVILVHRLLKNSIVSAEYLLMTEEFAAASGCGEGELSEEACEGFDRQKVRVIYPNTPAPRSVCHMPVTKVVPKARAYVLSARSHWRRLTQPKQRFPSLEAL